MAQTRNEVQMPAVLGRSGRKQLKSQRFADGFNVPVSRACDVVGVSVPTLKTWLEAGKCPYGSRTLEYTIRDEDGYRGTWWMRQGDVTYLRRVVARKIGEQVGA